MADATRKLGKTVCRVGQIVAVGLTLLAPVACARHPVPDQEEFGPAQLTVENQEFLDFDVFVVTEAGMRLRLGMATGHSTTDLQIPRAIVDGGAAHLYFIADPVGGTAAQVGEMVVVNPGDQIGLTIAPY